MPKRKILKTEKRKILGRKVKKLRSEGLLPGNIYGKNISSTAVQLERKEFEKLFAEVGETELIDLQIGKEKKERPVLIHGVQLDPVTDAPLHVDFMQVDLTEKVAVAVPIEFINEAPAVKEGKGILLELLSELEVEALPADLPSKIEVDIAGLKKVDDAIVVSYLQLPKGVEVKTGPKEFICKIEPEAPEAPEAPEEPATTETLKETEAQRPATTETQKGNETLKDEK